MLDKAVNNERFLHLDLFSGIGGFALAADRVFGNVEHVFCDNEPFAQAVLSKHWPSAPIFSDIRNLTADAYRDRCAGRSEEIHSADSDEQAQRRVARRSESSGVSSEDTERKRRSHGEHEKDGAEVRKLGVARSGDADRVYLLTGGFPCQPFSQAGRRKGEADDRFLWPEMCRVIGEFRPEWVIAENVRGLLTQGGGVVFERVCTDLEALGYEVQPIVIPAVAVGAPHRRDRVWFVAHAKGGDAGQLEIRNTGRKGTIAQENRFGLRDELSGPDSDAPNTTQQRCSGRNKTERWDGASEQDNRYTIWPESTGEDTRSNWQADWLEVATRLCALDDGLPGGLVRPRGWRNAALKAAGNAIVPQVAEEIMRAIKYADDIKDR